MPYIWSRSFISVIVFNYLSFVISLIQLAQRMEPEDVQLLEQLFILEGIFFNPNSFEEVESAYEDITSRTISSLQKTVEELATAVDEVIFRFFAQLNFEYDQVKLAKNTDSFCSEMFTA